MQKIKRKKKILTMKRAKEFEYIRPNHSVIALHKMGYFPVCKPKKQKVVLVTPEQYRFYENRLLKNSSVFAPLIFIFVAEKGITALPFKFTPLTKNIDVLKEKDFDVIDIRKIGNRLTLWKKALYK